MPHARSAAASHPRDCQPKRISSSLTGVTAGLAEQKRCHVTLGETLSVFLSSGYECSRLCPRSCATTYRDCTVQLSRLVLIKPRSLFQLRVFRSYRHVEKHAEKQIKKISYCTSHWDDSKTLSRTSPSKGRPTPAGAGMKTTMPGATQMAKSTTQPKQPPWLNRICCSRLRKIGQTIETHLKIVRARDCLRAVQI